MKNEFRNNVLKLNQPRVHKINQSLGVYDAYKYIRKNKWFDIGRPLKEHEFYTIIRQVNDLLVNSFLEGNDIALPHRLGTLELRKFNPTLTIKDGKLINTLPIDWDRTLKLWAEDNESFKNKVLIKLEEKEVFRVFYNRKNANYQNKSFMQFKVNRDFKRRLKQKIKNKSIDAFKL